MDASAARFAGGLAALHLAAQPDLPGFIRKLLERSVVNVEQAVKGTETETETEQRQSTRPRTYDAPSSFCSARSSSSFGSEPDSSSPRGTLRACLKR